MTKLESDAFHYGVACALGTLIRSYDEPTIAASIIRLNGIKLSDFKKAEVNEFDLKPIRKALRENPLPKLKKRSK